MQKITYAFSDGTTSEVEISDELYAVCAEIEKAERLSERRETRRHQSLNKAMEHGFDVPDTSENVFEKVLRLELRRKLSAALSTLTERQHSVFLLYAALDYNFREIGELLHIGTQAVWEHYNAAVKKLKKILEKLP